jgi:hypothetical protein
MRISKIQNKPGNRKRDNTDRYHAKSVYDLEVFGICYHRDGIEESPDDQYDAEEKETSHPAVARIAKPKQSKNIGKNTA